MFKKGGEMERLGRCKERLGGVMKGGVGKKVGGL